MYLYIPPPFPLCSTYSKLCVLPVSLSSPNKCWLLTTHISFHHSSLSSLDALFLESVNILLSSHIHIIWHRQQRRVFGTPTHHV